MRVAFRPKGENIFIVKQKKASHGSVAIVKRELKNMTNSFALQIQEEKNILHISFHAVIEETNKQKT